MKKNSSLLRSNRVGWFVPKFLDLKKFYCFRFLRRYEYYEVSSIYRLKLVHQRLVIINNRFRKFKPNLRDFENLSVKHQSRQLLQNYLLDHIRLCKVLELFLLILKCCQYKVPTHIEGWIVYLLIYLILLLC